METIVTVLQAMQQHVGLFATAEQKDICAFCLLQTRIWEPHVMEMYAGALPDVFLEALVSSPGK